MAAELGLNQNRLKVAKRAGPHDMVKYRRRTELSHASLGMQIVKNREQPDVAMLRSASR